MVQYFDTALDRVATKLSQFQAPRIPELPLDDEHTLQNNMLESLLGVFSGEANKRIRHLMTNLVRRADASVEAYRKGRELALEYASFDRSRGHVLPYFRALAAFEQCITHSWQVSEIVSHMTDGSLRMFNRGDGSDMERLHAIYTFSMKHAQERYDPNIDGEMPTEIWLTNAGISGVGGTHIGYEELRDIVGSGHALFYGIQKRAHEKLAQQRKTSAV
jgi:hypothetical protein